MDNLYYSNDGRGPFVARVVNIDRGIVTLEYRRESGRGKWTTITLSEEFLKSKACGWKKRQPATTRG